MKEFFSLEICNPKPNKNTNNKNENNNNNNNENNNNNKLTLTKNIIEENKDINELNTIKQVKIIFTIYIFKNIALQLGKNLLHSPRKNLHSSKILISFPRRIPSRSKILIYNLILVLVNFILRTKRTFISHFIIHRFNIKLSFLHSISISINNRKRH
jgi:hypothetical protein